MDFYAIVLAATAAIDLFAVLMFAFAFARRSVEREYRVAAVLAGAAAFHASVGLVTAHAPRPIDPLAAAFAASSGLILALPFAVHFAVSYLGPRQSKMIAGSAYGIAAVSTIARVVHASGTAEATAASAAGLTPAALDGSDLATHVVAIAIAATVLVLVARAYLVGKRGALVVVVGATILVATLINDLGVASGAFTTGYLADPGLAALIVGIATTPNARYAAVTFDLQKRTEELRARTKELSASYEELRTAQEELLKKEQLAVVGELAAVIAHEVRNPLAIISNAVSGLRKSAISREDYEVLLSILDEEASRLNRLVSDLLRYARPVNVQRSHVAVEDLLERALSYANTGTKTIRMELDVDAPDKRLWGDANLLRQVFDNLIDNAVQAMNGGGNLTVRVREATTASTDGLRIDIIDTGEGMDTQVRSRALDPFFTTRPSGTGLGLAIVDRIVDAHGGQLSIQSRAGEGTTVTVFLPHGSASDPPLTPRSRPRGGSESLPNV